MNWRLLIFKYLIPASISTVLVAVIYWMFDLPITWGDALEWFCFTVIFIRIFNPTRNNDKKKVNGSAVAEDEN